MEEMQNKQKLHMEGIKYIISHTTDDRTKALAEKFLTDDQAEFELNKNSYIKPSKSDLQGAIGNIIKKREKQVRKENVSYLNLKIILYLERGYTEDRFRTN
jgi:hypothetical protein